jgi:hypothetical protein
LRRPGFCRNSSTLVAKFMIFMSLGAQTHAHPGTRKLG